MRCSTLRGTFCSLITLATPRQDWTSSNPNRREGRGCGFTLSRSHSCCAVWLVYIQISPGHIWTTLHLRSLGMSNPVLLGHFTFSGHTLLYYTVYTCTCYSILVLCTYPFIVTKCSLQIYFFYGL